MKRKPMISKVLRSLAKHKNIVTIVSALTVLGSFVLKEVWDEHLKDAVSSIRSVEQRVAYMEEQVGLWNQIAATVENTNLIRRKLIDEDPIDKKQIRRTQILDKTKYDARFGLDLSELEELLRVLPRQSYYVHEKNEIGTKIVALEGRYNTWRNSLTGRDIPLDEWGRFMQEWSVLLERSKALLDEGKQEAGGSSRTGRKTSHYRRLDGLRLFRPRMDSWAHFKYCQRWPSLQG